MTVLDLMVELAKYDLWVEIYVETRPGSDQAPQLVIGDPPTWAKRLYGARRGIKQRGPHRAA